MKWCRIDHSANVKKYVNSGFCQPPSLIAEAFGFVDEHCDVIVGIRSGVPPRSGPE